MDFWTCVIDHLRAINMAKSLTKFFIQYKQLMKSLIWPCECINQWTDCICCSKLCSIGRIKKILQMRTSNYHWFEYYHAHITIYSQTIAYICFTENHSVLPVTYSMLWGSSLALLKGIDLFLMKRSDKHIDELSNAAPPMCTLKYYTRVCILLWRLFI